MMHRNGLTRSGYDAYQASTRALQLTSCHSPSAIIRSLTYLQEIMALFEQREAAVADSPNQRRQLMEVQGMGEWQADLRLPAVPASSLQPGPLVALLLRPFTAAGVAPAVDTEASPLAMQCCCTSTWPPSTTWSWGRCDAWLRSVRNLQTCEARARAWNGGLGSQAWHAASIVLVSRAPCPTLAD